MKQEAHIFTKGDIASALLMLVALLWLTICTPFVYAAQQQVASELVSDHSGDDNSNTNPLAGTTEEKSESGISFFSEYLHHIYQSEHHFTVLVKYEKCHSSGLYLAFHPEQLVPPPKSFC